MDQLLSRSLEGANPVSIQEAIDQLDHYQNAVRVQLFRQLQRLANQPGEGLDEALSQLEACAASVISDSPEASIVPHIATYRDLVARIGSLTTEVSRKHAARGLQQQLQEFDRHLAAGELSEAAWCVVQLSKAVQDAEEALAEQQLEAQRQKQQEEQQQQQEGLEGLADIAPGEVASGARSMSGGGAGPDGQGQGAGAPPVTPESVALAQEVAEKASSRLRKALDDCSTQALNTDPQARRVVVRPRMSVKVEVGLDTGPEAGTTTATAHVRMAELFSALEVLGLQESYLKRMTDQLVQGALEPMLAAPCRVTVSQEALAAAADAGAGQGAQPATLTWQPVAPGSGSESGACDREHCCQHLLRLVAGGMLEFDEGLVKVFGPPLWRAVSDCYVTRVAAPFIAANPEDVEGCEAAAAAAADLEAFAESLNLTGDGAEPYLGPAVESLARHALSNRQEKYLERARQLLLGQGQGQGAGGWDTVEAGAPLAVDEDYLRRLGEGQLPDWEAADPPCGCSPDGPLLAAGRYLVSRRCAQLVGLVEGLVEDACAGSRAVARSLRSALSSIALMARTLPPAATASAASPAAAFTAHDVPHAAFTAYNDLNHLAAALLRLAAACGGPLGAALGEDPRAGLLGDAMALRDAARAVMREQLEHQYGSLDEALGGLDRLRHVGAGDAKASARYRRAVQQLLHLLGRLGRAACETLAPEEAAGVAAAALNHVCGQLVAAVLAKGDMGRDECVEVVEVLGPLVEGAVESWLAAARGAAGTPAHLSNVPLDVMASAITARAQQLRKLQCVLRVLRCDSIAAIGRAWEGGQLAALAVPELEGLLMAISEDSSARRGLLAALQQAGP